MASQILISRNWTQDTSAGTEGPPVGPSNHHKPLLALGFGSFQIHYSQDKLGGHLFLVFLHKKIQSNESSTLSRNPHKWQLLLSTLNHLLSALTALTLIFDNSRSSNSFILKRRVVEWTKIYSTLFPSSIKYYEGVAALSVSAEAVHYEVCKALCCAHDDKNNRHTHFHLYTTPPYQ